jgi:putative ABC transport system ATP-binding protein
MLNLAKIGKTFHTDDVETRALSSVELAIDKGEFVSINGPSGSGKSTLLSILGLLDVPSHGEYKIDGTDTAKLDPIARAAMRNKAIGFIFQAFNLIGDLTVEENVELPLVYRGLAPADRKQRVSEALESVRMSHRARHLPGQLSGGQQQRVAVARAVAGDPLILLADEPTGNLDSKNGDAVMELLEELHGKGATICMVTHNPDYAKKASRIVHLFDGRVVEDRKSA